MDCDLPQPGRLSVSVIYNLLTHPVGCCDKANRCQLCSSHQKKGSVKCETGKWEAVVTNDSIGTCSSVLYIDYLLKLPAPPRAALLVSLYVRPVFGSRTHLYKGRYFTDLPDVTLEVQEKIHCPPAASSLASFSIETVITYLIHLVST